jgi:hypothetical protein
MSVEEIHVRFILPTSASRVKEIDFKGIGDLLISLAEGK